MDDQIMIDKWLESHKPTKVPSAGKEAIPKPFEGPLMQSETIELDNKGNRVFKRLGINLAGIPDDETMRYYG